MSIIKLTSPVDGSIYAERSLLSDQNLDGAIEKARNAQKTWVDLPLKTRIDYCLKAIDALNAMQDKIVPELAWQMGRPIRYGAGELKGITERSNYMADIAEQALAPLMLPGRKNAKAYIERQALGIVFVIAPWNYPYLTAVNTIIPALIAGNVVILKHATQTLLVGERYGEAFEKADLPEGVFQNLLLNYDQCNRIISHGLVNRVNFTGSVRGGEAIEKAAAGSFCHVGLELGGKDPAYVCEDADFDKTVDGLLDGTFFNSGQCCCGIERIYVAEKLYDDFLNAFAEGAKKYQLGSPLDQSTTLGPMASVAGAKSVRAFNAKAIEQGATAHIDAKHFDHDNSDTAYIAPQVLSNVTHAMSFMKDEVFGPTVGIMSVSGDQQAVDLMNDSDFGLTASIWSKDIERAEMLAHKIPTGTCYMNRCDYLDPGLGWTGIKRTGRGVTLSAVGYEHLTRIQSFYLQETP